MSNKILQKRNSEMPPQKICLSLSKSLQFQISPLGEWQCRTGTNSPWFEISPDILCVFQIIQKNEHLKVGYSSLQQAAQKISAMFPSILQKSDFKFSFPEKKELLELMFDLLNEGVLLQNSQDISSREENFGDPWVQWAMLCDSFRNAAYEKAIEKIMLQIHKKNLIHAIDIGCGNGILSALCLKYKANFVFGIEETAAAKNTKKIISSLLKLENFELIKANTRNLSTEKLLKTSKSKSTQQLNYLVVNELFGNDPFSEGMIPTLENFFENFCRSLKALSAPKVYSIPLSLEIFAEEVEILEDPENSQNTRIREFYNAINSFDKKISQDKSFPQAFAYEFAKTESFSTISFPIQVRKKAIQRKSLFKLKTFHLDSENIFSNTYNGSEEIKQLNQNAMGLIFWYRATLVEGVTLCNHPSEADFCNHWSPIYIPYTQKPNTQLKARILWKLNETQNHLSLQLSQSPNSTICSR
jgi:hypothetical protein